MTNCKGSYSINTFTRFVNLSFGRFQFLQYQYNDPGYPAPANDRTIKELDFSFAPSRYNLWTLIPFLTQSMKNKNDGKKKEKEEAKKALHQNFQCVFTR